jgi:hypothetical protein
LKVLIVSEALMQVRAHSQDRRDGRSQFKFAFKAQDKFDRAGEQGKCVVAVHEDYRQAAALLWGSAGEYAAGEFARLNCECFAGGIPPMPVIIGLTAFGRCIGATRDSSWLGAPRITLAPELFNGNHRTPGGPRMVSAVLVHEMLPAALYAARRGPAPQRCPLVLCDHEAVARHPGPRNRCPLGGAAPGCESHPGYRPGRP